MPDQYEQHDYSLASKDTEIYPPTLQFHSTLCSKNLGGKKATVQYWLTKAFSI